MANPVVPVAEIISIGDEMTSGARLDTNSQWISVALGQLGVQVLYHTTVGDSLDACRSVIRQASQRASIVVITGGLGPTADDLTRQAIADAAGVELEFNATALEHIASLFANRNRQMPEQNRVQAMFPRGSRMIPNPQGTAPGIDITFASPTAASRIFALPGVPAEMKQMWEQTVCPALVDHLGPAPIIRRVVIKCFGLGESEMESRLGGMIARQRSPLVGITVNRATISLRIEAIDDTAEGADRQIEMVRRDIVDRVGDFVFGEGDDFELQHAAIAKLRARCESICTIELGCDSLVSGWLAQADPSGDCHRGGIQAPTLDVVAQILGLDSGSNTPKAVSQALQQATHADWCLIVDRYPVLAGESDGSRGAAQVRFTIRHRDSERLLEFDDHLGGHPDIVPSRIAKAGLHHMYRTL
jgi:nicotinamide-nucleotide amidase